MDVPNFIPSSLALSRLMLILLRSFPLNLHNYTIALEKKPQHSKHSTFKFKRKTSSTKCVTEEVSKLIFMQTNVTSTLHVL